MRDGLWDRAIALALLPLVLGCLALLYLVVVPLQGRPFLYGARRMRGPEQAFLLFKIRTMEPMDAAIDQTPLGGDQAWRITPIGRVLRRSRLDELPQIFNVLRGDMRFIGPRPPLARYVRRYPALYGAVLGETPPGITGLATVFLHAREERLLATCRTVAETDATYRRRCIPIKARLDLLYRDRRCWTLNLLILWLTVARLLPGRSRARPKRGAARGRAPLGPARSSRLNP
ncbi:MAG: sugar transferase [Silicimonas sp.]|nr:sugar transferase [Silicimonas sp.]